MEETWQAERLELVFYNGCENRWQMFQHQEEEGELDLAPSSNAFFTIQMSHLLHTCQDALIKSQSVEWLQRHQGQIAIVKPESVPEVEWKRFVEYCHSRVHGAKRNALKGKLTELMSGKGINLQADLVPKLIAALPVHSDWDIFGQIHPMSTSSARDNVQTSWWTRFFVYELYYSGKLETRGMPVREVRIQVEAEAGGKEDHGEHRLDRVFRKPIDYYAFAKSPDEMVNAERHLYYSYAQIIDPAQQINQQEHFSWYAVWPVIACGYFHFLQVKLIRPNARSLTSCFKHFMNGKMRRGSSAYLILKESLRELLVQIRLSAFQREVTNWIRANEEQIREQRPEKAAVECFCTFAPLINEMRAIVWDEHVWAHRRNPPQENPKVSEILNGWGEIDKSLVDKDDEGVSVIHIKGRGPRDGRDPKPLRRDGYCCGCIAVPNSKPLVLWLFPEGLTGEFERACFKGTNMGRLSEQFQMVLDRVRFRAQASAH